MKFSIFVKHIFYIFIIVNGQTLYAQAPSWSLISQIKGNWADFDPIMVTDNKGNVFVAGSFSSQELTIGTIVLKNNGKAFSGADGFLAKYDQNGKVLWASAIGGGAEERIYGISTDTDGDLYVTGEFNSPTLKFGNITINCYLNDIFLAKYDPNGNVAWAKDFPGESSEGLKIACDNDGNIYIVGDFLWDYFKIDSNTYKSNGGNDFFIMKCDTSGRVVWSKAIGGTSDDYIQNIALDGNGSLYCSGYFISPSLTFGKIPLNNHTKKGYFSDVFVVKYDTSGKEIWANSFGGKDDDIATGLTYSNSGDIYFTGWFNSSSIQLGNTTLLKSGIYNNFIVKMDSASNIAWAKKIVTYSLFNIITSDESNNIYLAGSFTSSSVFFGKTILKNNGSHDIFIIKSDSGGNIVWYKTIGGDSEDIPTSLITDRKGNIYLSGFFQSKFLNLDSTKLFNTDSLEMTEDIFIAKIGNVQTSINQVKKPQAFHLFPNPTTSTLTIQYTSTQNLSLTIYNLQGKPILQTIHLSNQPNQQIDISTLPSGMYFLKTGESVKKFVKE